MSETHWQVTLELPESMYERGKTEVVYFTTRLLGEPPGSGGAMALDGASRSTHAKTEDEAAAAFASAIVTSRNGPNRESMGLWKIKARRPVTDDPQVLALWGVVDALRDEVAELRERLRAAGDGLRGEP